MEQLLPLAHTRGVRKVSVMREQLVSFTAVTEEQKDLEASPHGGLQMNGLCMGCI